MLGMRLETVLTTWLTLLVSINSMSCVMRRVYLRSELVAHEEPVFDLDGTQNVLVFELAGYVVMLHTHLVHLI